MEKHINNKFDKNGTILVIKNDKKEYSKMLLTKKINFELFIKSIKNNLIIFDSGMNESQVRKRSSWRTKSLFWVSLIIKEC